MVFSLLNVKCQATTTISRHGEMAQRKKICLGSGREAEPSDLTNCQTNTILIIIVGEINQPY
jgi:hypothetical protein